MSVMLSMIPLSEPALPSLEGISGVLAEKWSDLAAPIELEDQEQADDGEESVVLGFSIDGHSIFAALMPAPIPWSQLEGPCATSILWENAEEELKPSKAHLIVTVMSEAEPLELATLLTQATAAIATSMDEAIGIYWGNATLVVPTELFTDLAVGLLPEPPIPIWIDLRVGSNDAGGTAGFTTGMEALGHREFETENSTDTVGELRERFFGLASYVIENGPVINDGDTVGQDRNERVRVIYSESAFGHENPVMRLVWETEPASRPWWKFW